jgi:predicted SAM-dependent methyltransferase
MRLFGRSAAHGSAPAEPLRLHIGCGQQPIAGWINVDNQALPGVDRVLDVREGLPFSDAAFIYAEHFLEHLTLEEGLTFLQACRKALAEDGILRLSTPNLDWVFLTHYRCGNWPDDREALADCMRMNRAFHGWGHRFLYNRQTLTAAVLAAGFAQTDFHRYGESDVPELKNLERHEASADVPELPHVLIVQASGREAPREFPEELLAEYRRDVAAR